MWITYGAVSALCASLTAARAISSVETWEKVPNFILSSSYHSLICLNLALCVLLMIGKITQVIFFGKLRATEERKLITRILEYTLFKVIFAGSVIMDSMDVMQLIVVAVWFSVLGYLRIFTLLCGDRFDYLQTNAQIRPIDHIRIVAMLCLVTTLNFSWFLLCLYFFMETGVSVIFFLNFECFTLFLKVVQISMKYSIQMYKRDEKWENRATFIYFTDIVSECAILLATLAHYIQILFFLGISFSLITILMLRIKSVLGSLRDKISSYVHYIQLSRAIQSQYHNVTPEELEILDDFCAICRDSMQTAKQLPCSHIFHESCLRLWLEQHQSCPTCRYSLIRPAEQPAANDQAVGDAPPPQRWWVRFFARREFPVNEEMVARVREMVPHVPEHTVRLQLGRTGSLERTVMYLLDQFPPPEEEGQHQVVDIPPNNNNNNNNNNNIARPASRSDPVAVASGVDLTNIPAGYAHSAQERQARLNARKLALKEKARLAFLAKSKKREQEENKETTTTSSSQQGENDERKKEAPESSDNYLSIPFNGGIAVGSEIQSKKEEQEENVANNNNNNTVELGLSPARIPSFSMSDSPAVRRMRALEAAERRMRAQQSDSEE